MMSIRVLPFASIQGIRSYTRTTYSSYKYSLTPFLLHQSTFLGASPSLFRYIVHHTTTYPRVRIVTLVKVAQGAALGLTRSCPIGPANLQTDSCERKRGKKEKDTCHNIMEGIIEIRRISGI